MYNSNLVATSSKAKFAGNTICSVRKPTLILHIRSNEELWMRAVQISPLNSFFLFFFFAQPLTYDEQLNKKSVLYRTDQPTVLLESTPSVKDLNNTLLFPFQVLRKRNHSDHSDREPIYKAETKNNNLFFNQFLHHKKPLRFGRKPK